MILLHSRDFVHGTFKVLLKFDKIIKNSVIFWDWSVVDNKEVSIHICMDVRHSEQNSQSPSLDKKLQRIEEVIRKVATNPSGYNREQASKEWFDEECKKVDEEKNACRARPGSEYQKNIVKPE